jgi:hypothetical protein
LSGEITFPAQCVLSFPTPWFPHDLFDCVSAPPCWPSID